MWLILGLAHLFSVGGKKDFPQISAKLITNSDVELECVIEGSVKSVGKQRQEQYCKIA